MAHLVRLKEWRKRNKSERATINFLLYLVHCQQHCRTRVLWIRLHFRNEFELNKNVNHCSVSLPFRTLRLPRHIRKRNCEIRRTPFSCLFMFRKMNFFVFSIVIEIFLHQSKSTSRLSFSIRPSFYECESVAVSMPLSLCGARFYSSHFSTCLRR